MNLARFSGLDGSYGSRAAGPAEGSCTQGPDFLDRHEISCANPMNHPELIRLWWALLAQNRGRTPSIPGLPGPPMV
jgi:hypothetical protein